MATLRVRELVRVLRTHWLLAGVLGMLFVVGLILLPLFQYQINPDGVSYISIAEKYASFDIKNAVNGYWGPLLSWLVAPSFWLGIDAIVYIKLLQILVAVGIAAFTYLLLRRQNQNKLFAAIGASTTGLLGLSWGLAGPLTPDLLVCCLLLALVVTMQRIGNKTSWRGYALIGLIGALLYYSKAVGLLIFGVVWLVWFLIDTKVSWQPLKIKFNRELIQKKALALLVVGILMLPFVAAISYKYQQLTLGTSGQYNFALVGPQTEGHPMMIRGLMAPPNDTAISIWEDVSDMPLNSWSPLDSWENLSHLVKVISYNTSQTAQLFIPTMWPFLLVAGLYLLRPVATPNSRRGMWLLAVAGLASVAAYLPIFTEQRYVYVAYVAVIVGFVAYLGDFWQKYRKNALPALLLGAVALVGLWWTTAGQLQQSFHITENIYLESKAIGANISPGSHIASDDFGSIYLCYHTKTICYGVLNMQGDVKAQLDKFAIEYLVLAPQAVEPIQQATGLTLTQIDGLLYAGRNLYTTH